MLSSEKDACFLNNHHTGRPLSIISNVSSHCKRIGTMMYASSVVTVLTLLVGGSEAFLSSLKGKNEISKELRMSFNRQEADSESTNGLSRRSLFGFALAAPCLLASEPATADDRIFKSNPLTNKIFEQVSPSPDILKTLRFRPTTYSSAVLLISKSNYSYSMCLDSNLGAS